MIENIKADVLDSKDCEMTLGVEIPYAGVQKEVEKKYLELKNEVSLSGFRKGKVPMDIIKKHFSQKAQEEAINDLIRDGLSQVVKEKNINIISFSEIEDLKFDQEKPLSFRAKIEVEPEFKLKDYKNLPINKNNLEVTPKDIEEVINNLRERNTQLIDSERVVVEKKDFVLINYHGFLNGDVLEKWKGENFLVNIERNNFIEGFNEQLIGLEKEKEKDVKVSFPGDYFDKKVAGKEVEFKVKIVGIKEKKMPEISDDFAKDMGCSNLDELNKKISEGIKQDKELKDKQDTEEQLIEGLIKKNPIPVPPSQVNKRLNYLVSKAKQYIQQQGIQPEKMGLSDDGLKEKYKDEAQKQVQTAYLFNELAKKENFQVSDEDIKKEIESMMNTAKEKDKAAMKEYLEKNKDNIFQKLIEDKIFNFLKENAKITSKVLKS